jgi:murein DD-endopeptidase MepM/ murein hydrolase activator NlpD
LGPSGILPAPRCGQVTAYAVTALLLAATPAAARSRGAAKPARPFMPIHTSKPVPFGVSTAPGPAVTRLGCMSTCQGDAVRPGSLLRVRGKAMRRVGEVVFVGGGAPSDDVAAAPEMRRPGSVDVRVPLQAPGGPVAVVDRDGRTSAPSRAEVSIAARPAATASVIAPTVELAVRSPRAYAGAAQPATLAYVVHAPSDSRTSSTVASIARWSAPQVAPGVPQTVTWHGTSGGSVQRDGRYAFRVSLAGVAGPPQPAAFEFSRDRFPVLGPHVFGTGAAAFGGGRGHKGQDVFAACGTPLVAAHAGTVKHAAFESRAGYYLVVHNDGPGTDYGYMHLRARPLVAEGEHVETGQPIGYVGDTGDADGCHLHFEIWTAPGWYAGGRPIDPLGSLRAWDRRG